MSYYFAHSRKSFVKLFSLTDPRHSETWEMEDRGWLYNWFDKKVVFVPRYGEREDFMFFEPVIINSGISQAKGLEKTFVKRKMHSVKLKASHAKLISAASLTRKPVAVQTKNELVLYFCKYGESCQVGLRLFK